MKTKSLFLVSMLLATVASGLVGCAKDMDPDDYREKQVQEEQTKIQAIAGTYVGSLVSQGATVGGFTLAFSPTLTVASGGTDDIAEQQVVVTGTMTITTPGQDAKILNFSDGSYYDVTQSISISTTISSFSTATGTPTAQSAAVVQVNATFNDDGTMSGSIQANSYPDTMATFSLTRNGSLPSASAMSDSSDRYVASELPNFQYTGTATFTSGGYTGTTMPVSMSVVNSDFERPDLAFYDFFLPIKDVTVTVSLGTTGFADNIFPSAEWDLRQGILSDNSVSSSTEGDSSYNSNLYCTAGAGASGKVWNCTYFSPAGTATMVFNETTSL